jgi:Protein of unknown function (DUF5131)
MIARAIVGGESGRGARPMEKQWVENIQRICRKSGVAFFFKQWGGVQKSKTGRLLNGKTHDDMPARIVAKMPSRNERLTSAQLVKEQGTRWKGPTHGLELVRL